MLTNKDLLFDAMFYSNSLPMWIVEEVTLSFVEVNQAAISFYGYSKDEFLSLTLLDIRPKEDYGVLEYNLNKSSNKPTIVNNVHHRLKSGATFLVEVITIPIVQEGKAMRLAQVTHMSKSF